MWGADHCLLFAAPLPANGPPTTKFGTLKFLVIDMVLALGVDVLYLDLDVLAIRHPMDCEVGRIKYCVVPPLADGVPPFDIQAAVDRAVVRPCAAATLVPLLLST
jgi:hypothetical protein